MTDATASRIRPNRRSPTELTFEFDAARVDELTEGEPVWLGADRRAAYVRFAALPIESNQLYTTYVDLRTAVLDDVGSARGTGIWPGRPALPRSGTTTSRRSLSTQS